jgi:formylglycine-generating enzyme required for sulfatase activity
VGTSTYPSERYPQTRQLLLTDAEVADLDFAELQDAIDEMYARYGASFKPDIRRHFLTFEWYHPIPDLQFEQVDNFSFSEIERKNRDFLAGLRDAKCPISLENVAKEQPWQNSLGMKFVRIAETQVWFSIWDTRVKDFSEFIDNAPDDYFYEATKEMWFLVQGSWKSEGASWKEPGFKQGTRNPVVGVSWDDAKAFCKWLTKREQAAGWLPQGMTYRLPTDEEWSTAVGLSNESGTTPKEKDRKITGIYPWGEQSPPQSTAGNYAGNGNEWSGKSTSPVGSFSANRYGLYDMGGNVWQWCEDSYDIGRTARVLRGASWCHDKPDDLLSSHREKHEPTYRSADIGFRCAVAPESSH